MHRHLKKYGAVLLALILIVSSVMPVLAEVDGIGPDDDYLLEGVYGEAEFLLDDDEASPGDALPSDTELEEVEYLNEDGVLETRECYVIKRSLNGLTLKEGEWYAIKKSYSISGRIINQGTEAAPAHLILADGSILKANWGIENRDGNALVLYGGENGTGVLIAKGGTGAGIGGSADHGSAGMLTVNGGNITAAGHALYAGIGGGDEGDGGLVIINGGTVKSTGGSGAAGIGTAYDAGSHGDIEIGDGYEITAGSSEDDLVYKPADQYDTDRDRYVRIALMPTYCVEHYQQMTDGSGYTFFECEDVSAHTGELTKAEAKIYEGFTVQPFEQKTVSGDSTKVDIYYDRISCTLSFDTNGFGKAPDDITVLYGANAQEPKPAPYGDYRFVGWYEEKECTHRFIFTNPVTSDKKLYAWWVRTSGDDGGNGSSHAASVSSVSTYSDSWYVDGLGTWRFRNRAGQDVVNAWLCDDKVTANGQNVWYLLTADGSMAAEGLIQDNTGNFYSLETEHNGYFGMLRYKDGYYNCNGQNVYLTFNREHGGSFGAITNTDGIEMLKAIYGVKQYGIGNESSVYSSAF